jgi:hypothetical protein
MLAPAQKIEIIGERERAANRNSLHAIPGAHPYYVQGHYFIGQLPPVRDFQASAAK